MAYSEAEARSLVIKAGLMLLEKGLVSRTWGNISARISDTEFIISPSGRSYEDLQPEELVKCKIEDCSYEGNIKPSSERGIHADSYRLRPGINFVIHTHQFYATVVGTAGEDLKDPFVPCAAYGMPSTAKLRRNVETQLIWHPETNAVLMTRHGALCLGETMEETFEIAESLEEQCRSIYLEVCGKYDGNEIKAVSNYGKTLYPAIDDLAQIAGVSIRCCDPETDLKTRNRLLKGRNALLVKGAAPVCTGDDMDAVYWILKKGCAAALFTGSLKGLRMPDALLQRMIYVKKYSKRK